MLFPIVNDISLAITLKSLDLSHECMKYGEVSSAGNFVIVMRIYSYYNWNSAVFLKFQIENKNTGPVGIHL